MATCRVTLPDLEIHDQPIVLGLWLVKKGARVAAGAPLVEVLCGGVTIDLPAPAEGVLIKRFVGDGATLRAGQHLATIELDDP